MKLRILFTLLVGAITLFCHLALADNKPNTTLLKGRVILNQIGGEGIANIAISADAANAVVSNTDGRFILVFNKKPGDPYRLGINRPGWTVVNTHLLWGNLPNSQALQYPNPKPIILAKSEQRQQWAMRYYRIELRGITEQNFKLQLAQLEGDNVELHQQRVKLRQDKDKALNQVDEMARQLAKADLTNKDNSLYQQALSLFLQSKVDEALEVLSDAALEAELSKLDKKQQQLIRALALKGNTNPIVLLDKDAAGEL
ncbi:MAG: hypothetical protein MJK04_11750 [Psychrosphaera sp.]|nr:hypothetical protein [Psychrosphaera sp.]